MPNGILFLYHFDTLRHIMTIEDDSLQTKKRGEVNEIYCGIPHYHAGAEGCACA
jgi:hypothetical protein